MGSSFLDAPQRQATSLSHVEHRPWRLPERSWLLAHTLEDQLFAHWRVPVEEVRAHVPDGLSVDEHDGSAWLGITPFRMTGVRLRGTLPIPLEGVSTYLQLNVRTYVKAEEKPGIWFFSLDASTQWVVEAARRRFSLPYFRARMSAERRGDSIHYECVRTNEPGRAFSARYRPVGEVFNPAPGSLEHFLTERYCLYTVGRDGRLARAEIHHAPWELHRAETEIDLNTIAPLSLPDDEPLCHVAARTDVVTWSLQALAA
jgi:uncharacterized protein YqjF (DUF2071 family)